MSAAVPGTEHVFGIYGYEFSRPFHVDGISLIPLFAAEEASRRAEDKSSLQLTGYGRLRVASTSGWDEYSRIRVLAAGMTFTQQQHVLLTRPISISPGDSVEGLFDATRLGRAIALLDDRHTIGAAIIADRWYPTSRADFLRVFDSRFRTEVTPDPLRLAFFRQIEIARLVTPYIELHHFLAFSALELLARSTGPYTTSTNAAIPINHLLQAHGFASTQLEIEKWTAARNAAFHRGQLETLDSTGSVLRLGDQLYPLTQVLADVLLKLLPFDDGHINWNRWRDRMAFT